MKQPIDSMTAGTALRTIAAAIAAAFGTAAWAQLPTGGTVANGSAAIATDGGRMTVTNSPNAVLNWQSFSVGARNSVHFAQQSAASQVLNRVIGNDPSAILGSLSSNGGVWLVNPHGVLFGSNARIDVAGLVATTLPISNADFLAGRMRFDSAGLPGGQVLNQGEITTSFGGRVWLMGDAVRNEGLIHSPGGNIVLAAGKSIELVDSGMPNVTVRISAPDNAAVNLGTLLAPGGGSIDVHGGIVNQGGIVRADSLGTDPAGRIVMKAQGDVRLAAGSTTAADATGSGRGGRVLVESADGAALVQGDVSATSAAGTGGRIHLLGHHVGVYGQAQVDASGATGADEILVGGDYQGGNPAVRNAAATYFGADAAIRANATAQGDGGKVILWGDDATRAFGTIEARGGPGGGDGGLVETSGHFLDARPTGIDVRSAGGKAGTWLLDPGNITIVEDRCCSPGGPDFEDTLEFTSESDDTVILASTIVQALQQENNVVVRTGGGAQTSQPGTITVAADIAVSGDPTGISLTLEAHHDIIVEPGVAITAGITPMAVKLTADSDANNSGKIVLNEGARIASHGADILLFAANGSTGAGDGIRLDGASLDAGSSGVVGLTANSVAIGPASDLAGFGIGVVGNEITVSGATLHASGLPILLTSRNQGKTGSIALTGSLVEAETISVRATSVTIEAGTLTLDDTKVLANGDIALKAGIDGTLGASEVRGRSVTASTVSESGKMLVQGSTLVAEGGTASVDAGTVTISQASRIAGTDVSLVAGNLAISGSDIAATEGTATLDGGGVTVENSKVAGNFVNVIAGGITLSKADLTADGGTLTLDSGGIDIAGSTLTGAKLIVDSGSLDITGSTLAALDGPIDVEAGATTIKDSTVTGTNIVLDTGTIAVEDAVVSSAEGTVGFDAGTLTIRRSTVTGTAIAVDTGTFDVDDSDLSATAGALTVNTGTMAILDSKLAGTRIAVETGTFEVDNSTLSASAGSIDIDAGDVSLRGGSTLAATDMIEVRAPAVKVATNSVLAGRGITIQSATTEISDSRLSAGDGAITLHELDEGTANSVALSKAVLEAPTQSSEASNSVAIFADRITMLDADVTAAEGVSIGGRLVSIANSTPQAGIQGSTIHLSGQTLDLDSARATAGGEGDALVVTSFKLTNTGSRFSTPAGRWLVYLTDGAAAFPAADLGDLDYTFVQVNASDLPPVRSGVGAHGIMMAAPLDLTVKVDATRVYDGTKVARFSQALSHDGGSGIVVRSREGNAIVNSEFDDRNAGQNKPILYETEGGYFEVRALNGSRIYGATQSYVADITPKPVTLADLRAENKVYDRTRTAIVHGTPGGIVAGDNVTLAGLTGQFDTRHVGTGKTVVVTGGTLGGADSRNYSLPSLATTRADITPYLLSGTGLTAEDKVYDSTRVAVIRGGLLAEALEGDDLSFSGGTGLFNDKNVGVNKPVTWTGGTLAGADAGNYAWGAELAPLRATITQRSITTAGTTALDKVYDGTRAATLAGSLSGALPGDSLSLVGATGQFGDKNAGTGKEVTVAGGRLDGADKGNYVLAGGSATQAAITRLPIAASGLTASDKVYDGTRRATVSGTLAEVLPGDDVTLSGATGTFADKNAGTGKTVTIDGGTLAGADAGNYEVRGGATARADITPRSISATGIAAADRVYDGTRVAVLSGTLSEVLAGDDVSLDGATGLFADKNAGVAKPVAISAASLSGADAGNYALAGEYTTSATITPRPISAAGITAADKVYDGTRTATLAGALAEALPGDVVALAGATGQFADKNAGTGKVVTVTGGALSGADAGNYTLTSRPATTAAITPRPIDASGLVAADKVYDGSRDATLFGTLSGAIAGDAVALAGATGQFDTKDVGANKTVAITGGTLAGADAGNYVLASGATARAAITPRPVAIGIAGPVAKEYDATTAASVGAGQFVLDGAIAGDAVSVQGPAQGSFDSANVGQGKTVSVTGAFQISGTDAFNYRVGDTSLTGATNVVTATASGNIGAITPATLVYTAAPVLREPGAPLDGLTGTVTGFKGADSLASATTGVLVWQTSGTSARPGLYPVIGAGLSALNYVLVQAPGNTVALEVTTGSSPAAPPQRARETSVDAIASALRTALPAIEPPRLGSGVLDMSNPAVARTYGAVKIGAMSQNELSRMIEQRRDFKRKLFADAIYKLELDPSLADVGACTTVLEASSGACRLTPNQLDLIQADTRLAALAGKVETAGGSDDPTAAPRPVKRAASAHVPQIERKIAVLFGINNYADKTIPPLENAVPDVDAVSALLQDKLGYDVRVVRDPTKADIIRTLNQLSVEINNTDSVVIYYAGHGFSLEKNGTGYWLPADASASEPSRWISNNDVARLLSGIRSSQMVLISDSCYSGAFARDGMDAVGRDVTPEGVLAKRSVVVISSGGDEPVADEGKAGHSIFAWNLMEAMRSVSAWKPGSTVFNDVQAGVRKEFPQTPKYGSVTAAGHQAGGDYLFELR